MSAWASGSWASGAWAGTAWAEVFVPPVEQPSTGSGGGRFIPYYETPFKQRLVSSWDEEKQKKLRDALLRQAEDEELKRLALENTYKRQRAHLLRLLEIAQRAQQLEKMIVLLLDQSQKHRQKQDKEIEMFVRSLELMNLL